MSKTGCSMQGKLENTNNVKRVASNCKTCFHISLNKNVLYCKHYDLINPNKKKCARYYFQKFEKAPSIKKKWYKSKPKGV